MFEIMILIKYRCNSFSGFFVQNTYAIYIVSFFIQIIVFTQKYNLVLKTFYIFSELTISSRSGNGRVDTPMNSGLRYFFSTESKALPS